MKTPKSITHKTISLLTYWNDHRDTAGSEITMIDTISIHRIFGHYSTITFLLLKLCGYIRCKQLKLQVNFFSTFFTSSNRVSAADYRNLLFSLNECFLPVKKYDILEECRFLQKPHSFQSVRNILLRSFFQIQHRKLSVDKLLNRL